MAFHSSQAGMAIFLLVAAGFNLWFVLTSFRRAFLAVKDAETSTSNGGDKLVSHAVFAMASFDILWVWMCMIQCWNNTVNDINEFNQNSGDESFGCKFMGWYSSFSLVGMMGSHCLVVYYLMNHLKTAEPSCLNSAKGVGILSLSLLLVACLFASMPLMQGDGYALTSGGFCYADFTNKAQASVILSFTLSFLAVSTALWTVIGNWREYWYYYAIFFCTWILWVPAASYGIANDEEIASPYMLIGAIAGHGNAIINPLLYGIDLFRKLNGAGDSSSSEEMKFKEASRDIA
ncbi:hypothetical protein ACHAXS_010081 [Conticribra weissflogii]